MDFPYIVDDKTIDLTMQCVHTRWYPMLRSLAYSILSTSSSEEVYTQTQKDIETLISGFKTHHEQLQATAFMVFTTSFKAWLMGGIKKSQIKYAYQIILSAFGRFEHVKELCCMANIKKERGGLRLSCLKLQLTEGNGLN